MILTKLLSSAVALTAVAVAANPYGIVAHLTWDIEFGSRDRECESIHRAGIGWIRADCYWHQFQKEKGGPFDFSRFEAVLTSAEKQGIQVLPILSGPPSFAAPVLAHLDQWEVFVRELVKHFGKRLPVLEVWNEENVYEFVGKPPLAADYLPLLKRTHDAAHSVNPSVRVMIGGLTGVPFGYIEELYKLGGKDAFDIMNVHPYTQPWPPENRVDDYLGRVRGIMAKNGDDQKPLWITEIGWPTQAAYRLKSTPSGLLAAGWKIANPGKKLSRVIAFVNDDPDNKPLWEKLCKVEFPGAQITVEPSFFGLAAKIKAADYGAVVFFKTEFAPDTFDALLAYVQGGGTLILNGGPPLWDPYVPDEDGHYVPKNGIDTEILRKKLCIGVEAWWNDPKRIPDSMKVQAAPALQGVFSLPKEDITGSRFLKPQDFRFGDAFIPLLTGAANGYTGTVAAVYKFASGRKGAMVVCAQGDGWNLSANSLEKQARMVVRAALLSFACGVERFFPYEYYSPELDPYDCEWHFGIVYRELSPKPAYAAYAALAAVRPADSVNTTDVPWRSADGFVFFPQWKRPGNLPAGAIWTMKETRTVSLTFSSANYVFSPYREGASAPVCTRDGANCQLTVTGAPLYFSGAELKSCK